MRRRAGVGAVQKQKLEQEKYRDKGSSLQETQLEQMSRQMEAFRAHLEAFAAKHKAEIRKNAQFRRQFQEMCTSIGVDPLASGKGFWAVLGMGDFYYELAVQIVEVCLATSHKNGGLIGLQELRRRLVAARGVGRQHQEITPSDLLAAARKLRVLGSGFRVVAVGRGEHLVQSVPGELSMDHTAVLQQVAGAGQASASVPALSQQLGWEQERAQKALDHLLREGMCWLDLQSPSGKLYWFPSLFAACVDAA